MSTDLRFVSNILIAISGICAYNRVAGCKISKYCLLFLNYSFISNSETEGNSFEDASPHGPFIWINTVQEREENNLR